MTVVTLFPEAAAAYRVLAIGAHPDDIEIGAGGTLARLVDERPGLTVDFVVMTSDERRRLEAQASAQAIAGGHLGAIGLRILDFRDAYLATAGVSVKEEVERLKDGGPYDVVFCPSLGDAHQDHRFVAELVWQTFRSSTILEYEIPKYEGISEQPNLFVELTRQICERKVQHLPTAFPSQADRSWFTDETFWAMLRLRGMEGASPTGYAEGFVCRKLRV